MGKLKYKLNHNLYAQNYVQSGGGHDFPVYRGKGGGYQFPVYRGQSGGKFGLGRILGKFIGPLFKAIVPHVKKQAVKHVLPATKKIAKRALQHGLEETQAVLSGKKKLKQGFQDMVKSTGRSAKNEALKRMKGGRRFKNTVKSIGKPPKSDVFSQLPRV